MGTLANRRQNQRNYVVCGGDGGIRTPGKGYPLRQFSKLLVSATHPRLHRPSSKCAIASECGGINRMIARCDIGENCTNLGHLAQNRLGSSRG